MKFGYCRCSSDDQNLYLQRDALQAVGCDHIFEEKESGAKIDRPELLRLMERLRSGDVVVVWRLDRLGRSLKHLIEIVEKLEEMGVGFQSVTEPIDTTTSGGKLACNTIIGPPSPPMYPSGFWVSPLKGKAQPNAASNITDSTVLWKLLLFIFHRPYPSSLQPLNDRFRPQTQTIATSQSHKYSLYA